MLLLSVANSLGIYQNAAAQMQGWHMFYEPTFLGTISGMIEAAVFTYLVLFVFAWLYNRLAK
ncbi:hypothetical protein KKC32_02325 [Patescibacteria group bacterium]|nr:hypothetical protein [Patescibacteria group bacterium]